MQQFTGRLTEIWLENGQVAGQIACPPQGLTAPGQYLLAQLADGQREALPAALFPSLVGEGSFNLAPPLPPGWQPGLELNLRGPLGRGFQLPVYVRHVALAVLDASPARLLPLAAQALAAGNEVTLFCDLAGQDLADLPPEVEVDALAAFPAALPWADAAFFDLPVTALTGLRARLGLKAGERISCPAQALVLAPMPCAGLADCGACAVALRIGSPGAHGGYRSRGSHRPAWALACKDGPVFDLDALEW